jgi:hypothetical protein
MLMVLLAACQVPGPPPIEECTALPSCEPDCVSGPEDAFSGVIHGSSTFREDGSGLTTDGRPAFVGLASIVEVRLSALPGPGSFTEAEVLATAEVEVTEQRLSILEVAFPADADGDGWDDLVVSVRTADGGMEVHWLPGPMGDLPLGAGSALVAGPPGAGFGYDLALIPDRDGDGAAELTFNDRASEQGTVFLINVPSLLAGTAEFEDVLLRGVEGSWVGRFVDAAGDLDGDGLDDAVVGTTDGVLVLPNQEAWPRTSADAAAEITLPARGVGSVGDVSGDGYDDLIVLPFYMTSAQPESDLVARVYPGPFEGSISADEALLSIADGPNVDTTTAPRAIRGADLEGDEKADWILGGIPHRRDPDILEVHNYRVYRIAGGLCGLITLGDGVPAIESSTADDAMGVSMFGLPDLDGDGIEDFGLGSSGTLIDGVKMGALMFSGAVF